ncbi:hypothetical protein, partial [Bradyrhizobium sp.]|uniref:hypothetical protein n=1 Tax=Bradyrhizobium sp. TaxID=376 RepID=UPI003C144CD5
GFVCTAKKKPAASLPARAFYSCDDDNVPVICLTCQMILKRSNDGADKINSVQDFVRKAVRVPHGYSAWNGGLHASGRALRGPVGL